MRLRKLVCSCRSMRAGPAAVALVCASAALGATNYQAHVSVSKKVKSGHKFTVKLTGSSKGQAHLYSFLDNRKCAVSYDKEAQRNQTYKAGHPYFLQSGEGGKVKATYDFLVISGGHYKKSAIAHSGTITGRQYACAYVLPKDRFGNFLNTAAHARASYKVTK